MQEPILTTPEAENEAPPRKGISPFVIIFFLTSLMGLVVAATMLFTEGQMAQSGSVIGDGSVVVQNRAAPDFVATMLDGTSVSLADYRGRIVFVNFWATWCVPCVEEMPALQQFVREQADDDNAPVVLLINQGESIEDITAFLASINVTDLPVLLDPDFDISDDYSVSGLPTTYIIDESGVMRYFKLGEMTVENMYTYLDALNPNGADGA